MHPFPLLKVCPRCIQDRTRALLSRLATSSISLVSISDIRFQTTRPRESCAILIRTGPTCPSRPSMLTVTPFRPPAASISRKPLTAAGSSGLSRWACTVRGVAGIKYTELAHRTRVGLLEYSWPAAVTHAGGRFRGPAADRNREVFSDTMVLMRSRARGGRRDVERCYRS